MGGIKLRDMKYVAYIIWMLLTPIVILCSVGSILFTDFWWGAGRKILDR